MGKIRSDNSFSGVYDLTITDANGCIGQDEIAVYSIDRPTGILSGAICEGQAFELPLNVNLTGWPILYNLY